MSQLTWIVTGCSSGIGKSLASALIARGERVVVTSRNLKDIAHLKSDSVLPLELDITGSPESVKKVFDEAVNTFGGIDVLVNNAGYLHGSFIEEAESVQSPYERSVAHALQRKRLHRQLHSQRLWDDERDTRHPTAFQKQVQRHGHIHRLAVRMGG